MSIFESAESAWNHVDESYAQEERPLQAIRKIVIKGSVDVVFRRFDKPTLVVAGETADAVASVKTNISGGKLVIEREGVSICFGHSSVRVMGTVGQIVHGDLNGPINIDMRGKGVSVSGVTNGAINQGKVVVGVALPEAPVIKIKGSGDMTLLDLQQSDLELEIEGSGDIAAHGQVTNLDVSIAGSGDVDASSLIAERASLSIAGSGDIEAFVRSDVRARVSGSGDIVIRGNPPLRNHQVAGSGKIQFR
ncbi:head GIN domain-containing protein [Ralstonia sp. 121560039-2]